MNKNLLDKKQYKLCDYFFILFKMDPIGTCILIINKVFAALLPALQVLFIAGIVDNISKMSFGTFNSSRMIFYIIGLVAVIIFSYLNGSINNCFVAKMEICLGKDYVPLLLEKTASLEYWHIENEASNNMIERVYREASAKIMSGFNYLLEMAELIIRVISLLAIVSSQIWWVGFVIILIAVPLFKLSLKAGKTNYEAVQKAEKFEREAKDLERILTDRDCVEERTLFQYSDTINKKWYEKYEIARKIILNMTLKNYLKMKLSSIITLALSFIIVGVLLLLLISGNITLGMFIALVSASFNLIQLMSWQLAWITEQIARAREYLNDLTKFLSLSEDENVLVEPSIFPVDVKIIEFINVSFKYPNTEKYILKNFSLRLQKGKHYAIVGVNGAGKTTITKLLTGLYDEYQGEILINNKNIKTYSKRALMDMFSIVYQDFAQYEISYEQNIKIGKPGLESQQRFEEALNLSGASEAILNLPNGLQTYLGKIEKDAVDISGGQWQRLAIARALYNPASVRILDEPTAALDPASESTIYRIFGEINKDVTTIFITHRMGAASLADIIIVIHDGCAAEIGTHDQLLKKHGIYADMFETQREWYT